MLNRPDIDVLLKRNEEHCEKHKGDALCLRIVAVADLPTRFGTFQIVAFFNNKDGKEHVALVHGDICDSTDVPVRLHSECLTGDALGSLRCDCRDQLIIAMKKVSAMDKGIILYLRQEGRGIGLLNKIKAYQLQDGGMDTVEANRALGFGDDERDYAVAAEMLRALTVKSIKLLTNNPNKMQQLEKHGINITGRIPVLIEPNEFNRDYLDTKRRKAGHMLDDLLNGTVKGEKSSRE
ncbi:GTP cyclohydrolase II [Candidatus Woesearchaeota archaeon CG11_big_fil_rev_8_21_14_0_20_57_5]|nr:MAG: GTP cyclohydrolase II [Candidatus Woesearchaeota archaeon CG11_big_fil_rev_8_21_14_0_20_57_5]